MRSYTYFLGVLALIFLSEHPVVAQRLALGVEAGFRTTGDLNGTLTSESKRYIVGPMLEARLPLRLSLEFEALYRRFGYTGHADNCCAHSITRERANSWEFPMMLKYRLPAALTRTFLGVGYAPRTVHGTDVSSGSYLSAANGTYTYYFNQKSKTSYSLTHGLVASGGVDLGAGHVRISPEVRYVHWTAPFLNEFGPDGSFQFISNQDEFFVLLGVSWR